MADPFQPKFVDLVRNFTATVGTGNLVLGDAAAGFRSFSSALQPGDSFYYSVAGLERTSESEVGRGTLQADGTISRQPIGGVPTNFSTGIKTVALVAAAEWFESVEASRSALAVAASVSALAESTTTGAALLTESGREGMFLWDSSNLSNLVSADPSQDNCIAPVSDPSGASGAWVRTHDTYRRPNGVRQNVYHFISREKCTPLEFGAAGDGVADDKSAFQAAADSGKRIRIPTGFNFKSSGLVVLPTGSQIEGDGGKITFDALSGDTTLFRFGASDGSASVSQIAIEGVNFECLDDREFTALLFPKGETGTLIDEVRVRHNHILYSPATHVGGDRWFLVCNGAGTRSNFDVSHNVVNGRMQLIAAGAHIGTAEDWLVSHNHTFNAGQSSVAFSISKGVGQLGQPCTLRRVQIINNVIRADANVSRAIFAGIDGADNDRNCNIYDLLIADNDIDILDAGSGTSGIVIRLGNLCGNIGGFDSEAKGIVIDGNRCRAGTYLQIEQNDPVTASGLSTIEDFVLRDTREADNDAGSIQTFLRHLADDACLIGNNLAKASIRLGANNGRITSTGNQYGQFRTHTGTADIAAATFSLKSRNDTIVGTPEAAVILETDVAGQTAEFVNPTINSNHATPTSAIEVKGTGAPAVDVYNLVTSTTWSTGKFVETSGTITDKTSNLADIDNQVLARANLSLGTAAIADSGDFAAAVHDHDDRYYTETETDALLSGKADSASLGTAAFADSGDFAAAVHDHDARYYTEAETDALLAGKADSASLGTSAFMDAEWTLNFTSDGTAYIAAVEAMTIDQGNAEIGTGTIAFEKSTTAAPNTFSSTALPATLEAGAWLKVSASSVSGFKATHLTRTA